VLGTVEYFYNIQHIFFSELKKDISAGIDDPLVDITSFEDKTLDEGYGTGGDRPVGAQSGNIVHQNMIKRYAEEMVHPLWTYFVLDIAHCESKAADMYGF